MVELADGRRNTRGGEGLKLENFLLDGGPLHSRGKKHIRKRGNLES